MEKVIIDRQAIHAMDEADARIGLDQLAVIQEKITAAEKVLQGIVQRGKPKGSAKEGRVFYSRNRSGNEPSVLINDHLKGLRSGKFWMINRYIQVDPVYVACVGTAKVPFEDRFRITESIESAKGILMLHGL